MFVVPPTHHFHNSFAGGGWDVHPRRNICGYHSVVKAKPFLISKCISIDDVKKFNQTLKVFLIWFCTSLMCKLDD